MRKAKSKPLDEGFNLTEPLALDGGSATGGSDATLGFVDKLPAGSQRVLLNGLALPMPPSANAAWDYRVIFAKEQKRWMAIKYTTNVYKAYTEEIGWRITEARARHWTDHPLRVQLVVCFKDKRKQDIDNRVKPLLDALKTAQLFKDDSQVEELEVRRGPEVEGGKVLLSVWEILPDRIHSLTWVKRPR
jgi:Holliday junction resolvase RusA-like endonuclease